MVLKRIKNHAVNEWQKALLHDKEIHLCSLSVATRISTAFFSVAALQRAVNSLTERHPILRAHFIPYSDNKEFRIVIQEYVYGMTKVEEYTSNECDLDHLLTSLGHRKYDAFGTDGLIKVAVVHLEDISFIVVCASRLILDDASLSVLYSELTTLYNHFLSYPTSKFTQKLLPPIPTTFVELVHQENQRSAPINHSIAKVISPLALPYHNGFSPSLSFVPRKGKGIMHKFTSFTQAQVKIYYFYFLFWCYILSC